MFFIFFFVAFKIFQINRNQKSPKLYPLLHPLTTKAQATVGHVLGSPESPYPVPSPSHVSAVAPLLAEFVARQQVLWRQPFVDRPFGHDAETIGDHLGRGYGPRRGAPTLVDRFGNQLSPHLTAIESPYQRSSRDRHFHGRHFPHLRQKKIRVSIKRPIQCFSLDNSVKK